MVSWLRVMRYRRMRLLGAHAMGIKTSKADAEKSELRKGSKRPEGRG